MQNYHILIPHAVDDFYYSFDFYLYFYSMLLYLVYNHHRYLGFAIRIHRTTDYFRFNSLRDFIMTIWWQFSFRHVDWYNFGDYYNFDFSNDYNFHPHDGHYFVVAIHVRNLSAVAQHHWLKIDFFFYSTADYPY